MRTLPRYPSLYQINTRAFLYHQGQQQGAGSSQASTLDDIPDTFLDGLAEQGFDFIWFLGVWQTGTMGREVSRTHPDWRPGFSHELVDLREEDITGSPFAVQSYTLHPDFGPPDALGRLRSRLNERGLRLLLDFVPNHVALDHPWTQTHPEFFIHGSEEDLARSPGNYQRIQTGQGEAILALGRDPYWPAWSDSLQLNHGNTDLREALMQDLDQVAGCCDAVRCDMTMLLLPEVFQRTWGLSMPGPFWPEATARVKASHPAFIFLAEVYWDLEWELLQQGFDFTYDKRLYDRLREGPVAAVRGHLHADVAYQARCARFLENHDEPRAAAIFPSLARHRAAAIITYLTPGLRFFHEGQLEGWQVQHNIHLRRRPPEPTDSQIRLFYNRLLTCLKRPEARSGDWARCAVHVTGAGEENPLLAWTLRGKDNERLVVLVNYSTSAVHAELTEISSEISLRDVFENRELTGNTIDLEPWGVRVFERSKG